MSTETKDGNYMLIFRGNDWYNGLSAEQMQQVFEQWRAWFNRLTDQGKALGGNPLQPSGKIVSGKNGRSVTDGPFAESKEAIGGYFLLKVEGENEALAIAKECPGLAYGVQVEVRPLAETCPLSAKLQAAAELAHA